MKMNIGRVDSELVVRGYENTKETSEEITKRSEGY